MTHRGNAGEKMAALADLTGFGDVPTAEDEANIARITELLPTYQDKLGEEGGEAALS
jgi:hypothetical protein